MNNSQHSPASVPDRFVIRVFDQEFASREVTLHDPRVLGRQIAHAAGQVPVDNAIVLRRKEGHALDALPLDESVELHAERIEQFVVGIGDGTYFFLLNGERHEWLSRSIRARVLLELAGAGEDYEVVFEKVDVADKVLAFGDVVDLGGAGIERFVTRLAERAVTVTYNREPFSIKAGTYTSEQLRAIFKVEPGYALDLIPSSGCFQALEPGQSIRVVAGLVFGSYAPTGHSS